MGCNARGIAAKLPEGLAHLAIHAINPYGFAWLRRVTEDNVDLNRNFVDFSEALPVNPGYEDLATAICPATWDEASIAETTATMEAYGEAEGAKALQSRHLGRPVQSSRRDLLWRASPPPGRAGCSRKSSRAIWPGPITLP